MNRSTFRLWHRQARLGNLGSLACGLPDPFFRWFLSEVYDLRFPHIGNDRHTLNGRTWDNLRRGVHTRFRNALWRVLFGGQQ